MRCGNCDAINPEGAGYCNLCGVKIVQAKPASDVSSATPRCPECGCEMPPRAAFCGKCGARLMGSSADASTMAATEDSAPLAPASEPKSPVRTTAGEGSLREMVLIPGGWFAMGAEPGAGNDDERPRHQVRLSPYYMDACAVSNIEFEQFAPNHRRLRPETAIGDDDPVVFVSYGQCLEYCAWRSEREKLPPNSYTLPTEAQWECAARAGLTGAKFPWGNEPGDGGHFNTLESERGRALPVNAGTPNGYGLHFMGSNVREWCLDWYSPTWYSAIEATLPDPIAPRPVMLVNMRVVRGAAFQDRLTELGRCSARNYAHPESAGSDTGFRCVRRMG